MLERHGEAKGHRRRLAAKLPPALGRRSRRRQSAASPSAASASSRARSSAAGPRSSGERYAKVSSPESIRFPAGRKAGGALTLLVEGAHAPLIQHLAPMIIERVNRFFGYAAIDRIVFRQGKPAAPGASDRRARSSRRCPAELGEGLREIADPELARLPGVACGANCRYQRAAVALQGERDDTIPAINRSE